MLKWFFKKVEKKNDLIDFSIIKTDIHSHLIPGIDDGSPNIDTTIRLILEMKNLGFRKLITSPHVMSDAYDNSSEKILQGLNSVRNELKIRNF